MPTIDITTPELTPAVRRRIAVRLTRWFFSQDTIREHVIIRFHTASPETVFAGGFPMDRLTGKAIEENDVHGNLSPISFAMVQCCISMQRDDVFRTHMAHELQQALELKQTAFLYVRFEPVDKRDVFYSSAGELICANQ